jgi:hypothetical protein
MKQAIVLSPTIIETLLSFSPEDFLTKVLKRFPDYVYIFDKNRVLLDELNDAMKNRNSKHIHPQTLDWMKVIISVISVECHCSPIEHLKKRSSDKWRFLETERVILKDQLWKIILADHVPSAIREETHNEGIEISSVANFLLPVSESMIRTPETVSKKRGEKFDIVSWVMKYVKDANKIQIEDPFVGAGNSITNLENILQQIAPDSFIILRGRASHLNTIERFAEISPMDALKEVARQLRSKRITVHIDGVEDDALSDRSIMTDDFDINLGHALGNVDPHTHNVKKQFKVTVIKRS